MSEIVIARPDAASIVNEYSPLVERARALEVVDEQSHEQALNGIKKMRTGEKVLTDLFEPTRSQLDKAKKELLALRDGLIKPLTVTRELLSDKASTYENEQRRIAQEEQRRLEEQARKREEERKLQDAIDAEAAGNTTEAAAILEEPVAAPVIHVAPAVAKVEGVSTQERWSADVTDKMALIKYVAANPQWEGLLDANMPALNRLAVTQRGAMQVPGVRAITRTIRAVR